MPVYLLHSGGTEDLPALASLSERFRPDARVPEGVYALSVTSDSVWTVVESLVVWSGTGALCRLWPEERGEPDPGLATPTTLAISPRGLSGYTTSGGTGAGA